MNAVPVSAAQSATTIQLDSLYDFAVAGGPVMVPLALCSMVALAYAVERALRLRAAPLGIGRFEGELIGAVTVGGAPRALELCSRSPTPLARVLRVAIERARAPFAEREKAVEDAGAREVRRLASGLRPLAVVAVLAPLLGFLGTVIGMIQAFTIVATTDALGKPQMLAGGIAQALITTATGLVIAIPAQAAHFWLRGRIERFARRAEEVHGEVARRLEAAGG